MMIELDPSVFLVLGYVIGKVLRIRSKNFIPMWFCPPNKLYGGGRGRHMFCMANLLYISKSEICGSSTVRVCTSAS